MAFTVPEHARRYPDGSDRKVAMLRACSVTLTRRPRRRPMMSVFNNLVLYDQHVPQNSPKSIVPELATGWAWNEEGTELTLPLRQGVKWHDGKPLTARDVKCTWDLLMDTANEKLRVNPRKASYRNL